MIVKTTPVNFSEDFIERSNWDLRLCHAIPCRFRARLIGREPSVNRGVMSASPFARIEICRTPADRTDRGAVRRYRSPKVRARVATLRGMSIERSINFHKSASRAYANDDPDDPSCLRDGRTLSLLTSLWLSTRYGRSLATRRASWG